MRSISDWIVRTTPDANRPGKFTGPVACAVFVAVLAAGVTGGTVLLANSMTHDNAAAYTAMIPSDFD